MATVGGVSLEGRAVEGSNTPLYRCELVQQGWTQCRCSRGCCRSTAALGTCQRRRSLRAWQGGAVPGEAAARMQAMYSSATVRCATHHCSLSWAQAALVGHTSSQSASILAARSPRLCACNAASTCSRRPHRSPGIELRSRELRLKLRGAFEA
jgi:hypothetical protein